MSPRPAPRRGGDVLLYVTWSELGNPMPTVRDLARLARAAPRDALLRGLAMTTTMLHNATAGRQPQAAMAHELLRDDVQKAVDQGFAEGRWDVFAHPEGILLAIRAVLRFGRPGGGDPSAMGPVLGPLILVASDLLGGGGLADPEAARAHLLRLFWFGRRDQSRYAIPRYYSLLTGGPSDPRLPNFLDLDATFRDASEGLSIQEFVASVFALYAMYVRYKWPADLERLRFGSDWPGLAAHGRDPAKRRAFERLGIRSAWVQSKELP